MRRGIWNWLFLLSSFGLAALFGALLFQEVFPEWKRYQAGYYRRLAQVTGESSRAATPLRIKQIYLPEFRRVDRCVTCHAGIDNPRMTGQPQPFAAHSDLGVAGFLQAHPFEEVGCTVCHHGQGRATTVRAAHGPVPHWEEPLLPGDLVAGTCTSCHADVSRLPGAERLVEARALFEEKGCIGCHNLHGQGMLVGPELDETFQKGPDQFDFRYVRGEKTVVNWIMDHTRDPQRVVPGYPELGIPETAMPNYHFTEEEIRILTALTISFASEKGRDEFPIPSKFKVPAAPVLSERSPFDKLRANGVEGPKPAPLTASSVERGQAAYAKYGCAACHGPEGVGGLANPNMDLGEEIPPLTHVADGTTREELVGIIREGRTPGRADPRGPSPPLWMPAWKDKISEEETEALADYLLSLRPAEEGPSP